MHVQKCFILRQRAINHTRTQSSKLHTPHYTRNFSANLIYQLIWNKQKIFWAACYQTKLKFAKKYGTKPVKINHLYKQANKNYKLFKQATETTIEAMLYKYYLENKQNVAYFGSANLYYQKSCNFIFLISAISQRSHTFTNCGWRHRWYASLHASWLSAHLK